MLKCLNANCLSQPLEKRARLRAARLPADNAGTDSGAAFVGGFICSEQLDQL